LIGDDLYHWTGSIYVQSNSPYDGGLFLLDIVFRPDYPFKPPIVKFNTRIYHPNVNSNGLLSVPILTDHWSPLITLKQVMLYLLNLITNPDIDYPMVPEIAQVYRTDRNKYNTTAADWTRRYAM